MDWWIPCLLFEIPTPFNYLLVLSFKDSIYPTSMALLKST